MVIEVQNNKTKVTDRLSGLSDKILCHILSFLPSKYTVGTSILSTRWRYLWTSAPVLDFDDSLRLYNDTANDNQEGKLSFINFVHRASTGSFTYIFYSKIQSQMQQTQSFPHKWIYFSRIKAWGSKGWSVHQERENFRAKIRSFCFWKFCSVKNWEEFCPRFSFIASFF